jgi:rSAM/selenodomain-associated transferase 1
LKTKNPRERLVVFARAPQLGKVKTRLCPPLSTEQALDLHKALVEETLDRFQDFSRPDLELWVYLSEALQDPKALEIPSGWVQQVQQGADLGVRLGNAFQHGFENGVDRFVVLGSDSPTVPLECVDEAFDELSRYDVVLGPCLDGGYYLLGCSRFVPEIFQGISWGKVTVLRETTEALVHSQRSFTYLIDWYDVDRDEDLVRLREEIMFFEREAPEKIPRRVQAVLPEEVEENDR